MPALRDTIVRLTHLQCDWATSEVAEIARVTPIAVERYCNQLCKLEVLIKVADHRYVCGPKAVDWRTKTTKTREGGNSKLFRGAQAVRDQLAKRDWAVRTGKIKVGEESGKFTTPAASALDNQRQAQSRQQGLVTVKQAAIFLNVSKRTLQRRIAAGEIPIVRISRQCLRIPKTYLVGIASGKLMTPQRAPIPNAVAGGTGARAGSKETV